MSDKSAIEKHLDHMQRRRHRMREDAHHGDPVTRGGPIPEHTHIPRGAPILIEDDQSLVDLYQVLRDSASFAYDTEFIGESSYHPRICLVQVATTEYIWLIDPQKVTTLDGFWQLVADPDLESITHSGRQDWEPVTRALGEPAANIFDTQLAAGFTGWSYPMALTRLAKALFEASLNKGSTFTMWDRRPLTPDQMAYAADDVRYLPALRHVLHQAMLERGVTRWFREEIDAMCAVDNFQFDVEHTAMKIKGSGRLSKKQWPVLLSLVAWRDEKAREFDLPARSFLKDGILVNLASRRPKKQEDLKRIRDLPSPIIKEYSEHLLELCGQNTKVKRPDNGHAALEEAPSDKPRVDAMFALMQLCCHSRHIDPCIVASRSEVSQCYLQIRAHGQDAANEHALMQGWRDEVAGHLLRVAFVKDMDVTAQWIDGGISSVQMNLRSDEV